jgi:hypothetical protein
MLLSLLSALQRHGGINEGDSADWKRGEDGHIVHHMNIRRLVSHSTLCILVEHELSCGSPPWRFVVLYHSLDWRMSPFAIDAVRAPPLQCGIGRRPSGRPACQLTSLARKLTRPPPMGPRLSASPDKESGAHKSPAYWACAQISTSHPANHRRSCLLDPTMVVRTIISI